MKNGLKGILLLLFWGSKIAYAQVGMNGNSPDKSSILDMSSLSNKGLLIPRINLLNLTDNLTIQNPASSLLVYNTNTALTGGVGYYYWDGSSWKRIVTLADLPSAANTWKTTGNAGTTPGTNFLGTTDNTGLVVKTNNSEQMRVTSGGNMGIGTSTPASLLHVAGDLSVSKELKAGGNATTAGNPGTTGQVLTSNGSSSAPIWANMSAVKGLSSVQFFVLSTSTSHSTTGSTTFNNVPGLSYSYTAPADGVLIVQLTLYSASGGGSGTTDPAFTNTQMVFNVNGVATAYGMSTPVGRVSVGANPDCTTILCKFNVVQGQVYALNVQARDLLNSGVSGGSYVGTFLWNGYTQQSTMMGTLITN